MVGSDRLQAGTELIVLGEVRFAFSIVPVPSYSLKRVLWYIIP